VGAPAVQFFAAQKHIVIIKTFIIVLNDHLGYALIGVCGLVRHHEMADKLHSSLGGWHGMPN